MGLVHTEIELIRADDLALERAGHIKNTDVRKMRVKALVDSGALMLGINENIQAQLQLPKIDEEVATLADGSKVLLDLVGPIQVRFENRKTTVDALVLPGENEVLLGAIPMEGLDVIIDPGKQKMIINPDSPYMPKRSMK